MKTSAEPRELTNPGTGQFSGGEQNGRLIWFGHVERKHDTDWIKRYTVMETDEIPRRGEDVQQRHGEMLQVQNKWKIEDSWPARSRSPAEWPLITVPSVRT